MSNICYTIEVIKIFSVTDVGLNFLRESGLLQRIEENWDKINEEIPYVVIDDSMIEELLEKRDLPSERKRQLDKLQKRSITSKEEFLVASGKCTDRILTKEEVEKIKRNPYYNISLTELDGVIAAYCLMKDYSTSRNWFGWLSKEEKFYTSMWGDVNGDFHLLQLDMHPESEQKRIDGSYPLFGDLPAKGIFLHYDYWKTFTLLPFKYSKQTGTEFKELKNWKDLLNAEPVESRYFDLDECLFEFECDMIKIPEKIENDMFNIKKCPFGMLHGEHANYVPAIDKEKNLWFYMSSNDGILINNIGIYKQYMKISKENVPMILKGVIHAVKDNQTRMRPSTLAYVLDGLTTN